MTTDRCHWAPEGVGRDGKEKFEKSAPRKEDGASRPEVLTPEGAEPAPSTLNSLALGVREQGDRWSGPDYADNELPGTLCK